MDRTDPQKVRSVRAIEAVITRATGKRFQVQWAELSPESLREVQRLLRELEMQQTAAVRRARMEPWR